MIDNNRYCIECMQLMYKQSIDRNKNNNTLLKHNSRQCIEYILQKLNKKYN
jgi:hypothetical protein